MFISTVGKPGILQPYSAQPREVFFGNRQFAQYLPLPITIDGTLTSWPDNTPYTWYIPAGTFMGKVTATGKYANSILGLTTAAYAHTGGSNTTLQTSVNTAAEIVRRIGASGTIKLTGPATSGGTVATQVVTYSAVNTSTGAITITALGADSVSGSLIQPDDGSEKIVSLICDQWGIKVVDQLNTNRVDVFEGQLLAAGGTLNTGAFINYPTDTALQAWVKAAVRTTCPAVNFSDDFM